MLALRMFFWSWPVTTTLKLPSESIAAPKGQLLLSKEQVLDVNLSLIASTEDASSAATKLILPIETIVTVSKTNRISYEETLDVNNRLISSIETLLDVIDKNVISLEQLLNVKNPFALSDEQTSSLNFGTKLTKETLIDVHNNIGAFGGGFQGNAFEPMVGGYFLSYEENLDINNPLVFSEEQLLDIKESSKLVTESTGNFAKKDIIPYETLIDVHNNIGAFGGGFQGDAFEPMVGGYFISYEENLDVKNSSTFSEEQQLGVKNRNVITYETIANLGPIYRLPYENTGTILLNLSNTFILAIESLIRVQKTNVITDESILSQRAQLPLLYESVLDISNGSKQSIENLLDINNVRKLAGENISRVNTNLTLQLENIINVVAACFVTKETNLSLQSRIPLLYESLIAVRNIRTVAIENLVTPSSTFNFSYESMINRLLGVKLSLESVLTVFESNPFGIEKLIDTTKKNIVSIETILNLSSKPLLPYETLQLFVNINATFLMTIEFQSMVKGLFNVSLDTQATLSGDAKLLDIILRFIHSFPLWKIWLISDPDVYGMGCNMHTQSDTFQLNPEDAAIVATQRPAFMYFELHNVKYLYVQDKYLIMGYAGYKFTLDGILGTISMSHI
jgi:hypothetical protein